MLETYAQTDAKLASMTLPAAVAMANTNGFHGGPPSGSNVETFDLSRKLRHRLREMNAEKERTQAKINVLNGQLKTLFAKGVRQPRETQDQLDKRIRDLEYKRTTTSLRLSEEKKILREIDLVMKTKQQHVEYERHEFLIREKKEEISALKDALRTTSAAIAELETAVSKVDLADRLGCTPSDLKTRVIDCPESRIGRIIGKSGAALRQLESRTGVHVDVDRVGMKLHLQGNEESLDRAVAEIEDITLAVEMQVDIGLAASKYLVKNRGEALGELQEAYPSVYLDVARDSAIMTIRGRPEKIEEAKSAVLAIDVVSKVKEATSREVSLVVGKKGTTIRRLEEAHSVSIEIKNTANSDRSKMEVIGLAADVEVAFSEIEDMIFANEDLEESFLVVPMVRNHFLANSGAVMKALQADIAEKTAGNGGGIQFSFEKRSRDDPKSDSKVTVRANRTNMPVAKEAIQKAIDDFLATVTTIEVPSDAISAILGKGGQNINSLRKEGKGSEIEVDKELGTVKIQSDDEATKDTVRSAIERIVAENQVEKVEIEKSLIGPILGETGKEMRGEIVNSLGVNLSVSSDDSHVVLRGTKESANKAAGILRDFIALNYSEECEVQPEDDLLLISGGADSFINKVQMDHEVKATLSRAKHIVYVRGKKEKVKAAVKKLNTFLNGGDGFAVSTVKVPEGAIGAVIGKGGSHLAKLESDFKGISANLHRGSNVLSIRGPEEAVAKARVDVIKTISTARVNDTIAVTPEQREALSKGDTVRRITSGIPLQIHVTDDAIKLRGISGDVRDAKALIVERFTGTYEGFIDLEPAQVTKVKGAINDPSHFNRIESASGAEIHLDAEAGCIVVTGKRASVKKAKNLLFGFLDFLLPAQQQRFKVTKPLMKSMSDAERLSEIAASSGSSVIVERDLNCIVARSTAPENVEKAMGLLKAWLEECERLHFVQQFDQADGWILSRIIGRGGDTVQKLQKETGCAISVSKEERTVSISGESEGTVAGAKAAFLSFVENARREVIFIEIPESAMAAFIGKAGSHIKEIAESHSVDIERQRKDPSTLRIQGDEDSVQAANAAVSAWLKDWESKHVGTCIPIEADVIPAIIGKDGAVIRSIQTDTGCRVDIDRKALVITVRGGTDSQRAVAVARIEKVACEEEAKKQAKVDLMEEARMATELNEVRASPVDTNSSKSEIKKSVVPIESVEEKNDRTREFSSIPVGMTVPISKPKSLSKKKLKKVDTPVAESQLSGQQRGLFDLLAGNTNDVLLNEPSTSDEIWDSSTVSSAGVSTASSEPVAINTYFQSRSGFTVRL